MLIKIDNVSKQYSRKAKFALENASFEIPKGVYGLLGRNGAGKTTLLRIMATALPQTSGKILMDGTPIEKNVSAYRAKLGYLPQNTKLMPQLNIVEFLEYMCILKGITKKSEINAEIERTLAISGLGGERKKKLGAYSGGMLRRAGIAQALLGDPEILIVDEPTTGLDPEERLYFLNLISRIGAEKHVILSTHIIHDIENICPNVCILEKGKVMYAGDTKAVVERVRDMTWEAEIEAGQEQELKKTTSVTNVTYVGGKPTVRYISEKSVCEGSRKAEATLEDAYIYTVGGVSR